MKKTTKRVLGVGGVLVLVGVAAATMLRGDDAESEVETVAVERGTVTDVALAVGHIEPRVEVDVKSQVSGVVERLYSDEGEYVRKGTPLLEIQPTPTPKELVEADVRLRDVETLPDVARLSPPATVAARRRDRPHACRSSSVTS